jgi:DNA adenine methylase
MLLKVSPTSPLRYPGGKSRVARRIATLLPDFEEYREPFLGGGSVFLEVVKLNPEAKFWLNDLYPEVSNFWQVVLGDLENLVREVQNLKRSEPEGRKLYNLLRNTEISSDCERAARFFVLNRITFSGTIDSGGYSQQAFNDRFTDTSIVRLADLDFLKNLDIRITSEDYSYVVEAPGSSVAMFLDPPYITRAQKLYGKGGDLHRTFDHERFARTVLENEHSWLVTYNDGESVGKLFPKSERLTHLRWQQHYPMKTSLGAQVPKGRELIIANFELFRGGL